MQIKVHRGLEQIGGCITEIITETSRVFIDFGQNLPGVGECTTYAEDADFVKGILAENPREHQAVVYTHGHEDHIGLFGHIPEDMPQYIGEGSKELLLEKYRLLAIAAEDYCKTTDKEKDYPVHRKALNSAITAHRKVYLLENFRTWSRTRKYEKPRSFFVGDIRITPFFNCHSIYDSYMFLIEADGQRIWHTGDYREHGYIGKGLIPTLRKYATDIDVLITEGTMLGRDDKCIHEREVCQKMAAVMQAFKYIVVLASSTDIERLASIQNAAKKVGRQMYVHGGLMNRALKLFTKREANEADGLFRFKVCYMQDDLEYIPQKGFVLTMGASSYNFAEQLLAHLDLSETLLIYSAWDGYYSNPEQIKANPKYKEFRDLFHNVVDIHTSGHADKATIKKVIETVNPKKVICIHKDAETVLGDYAHPNDMQGNIK